MNTASPEAPKLLMNGEGLHQNRACLQMEILVSLALLAAPNRNLWCEFHGKHLSSPAFSSVLQSEDRRSEFVQPEPFPSPPWRTGFVMRSVFRLDSMVNQSD